MIAAGRLSITNKLSLNVRDKPNNRDGPKLDAGFQEPNCFERVQTVGV